MSIDAQLFPAKATFELPLKEALHQIWDLAQSAAVYGPIEQFGKESLGLDEQAFGEWYPRAWWGHYAFNACLLRFHAGKRHEEVMALLREVDLTPLDELLREGKGLILTMGHIGVLHVLGCFLFKAGRPALRITRAPLFQHPSVDVSKVRDPDFLAKLHTRALFHLREGGTVFSGPDGGPARKASEGRIFGRTVNLPRATPALARMSGAPSVPYVTRWVGYEIQLELFEPIRPNPEASPDEWEAQWNQQYLDWLERQYLAHPDIALFGNGLLPDLMPGKE